MPFRKRKIITADKKVFYWEKNHSNDEVLVFLHGFPGNHVSLLDLAKHFKGYRIIIPDLPGCGKSDTLDCKHNLHNYSEWLNCFLDALSIKKATFIGHSFGARVGLVFSGNYDKRVNKLVLITPVVKAEGIIARFVSMEYKIAEILPESFKKAWLSNFIHYKVGDLIVYKTASKKRRQEFSARRDQEIKNLNPQINIDLCKELYSHSLVSAGKKVESKTLVIAGKLDEIAPLDSVQELVSHIKNGKLVIMEKSGHVVTVESPKSTAEIIKKWFAEERLAV